MDRLRSVWGLSLKETFIAGGPDCAGRHWYGPHDDVIVGLAEVGSFGPELSTREFAPRRMGHEHQSVLRFA